MPPSGGQARSVQAIWPSTVQVQLLQPSGFGKLLPAGWPTPFRTQMTPPEPPAPLLPPAPPPPSWLPETDPHATANATTATRIRLSTAAHADRAAQPAEWNDGSGRSRIVSRPGGAARTFGIEFTTTDAVAMSPGTPLCIRKDSGGVHTDPGDNCIPSCLSKAQASGLCAGLTGPTCEETVNWYAEGLCLA